MSTKRLAIIAATFAAFALTACSPASPQDVAPEKDDDGTVITDFGQVSETEGPVGGIDEALPTTADVDENWISAPWALAGTVDKDSVEVPIIYVWGNQQCEAHATYAPEGSAEGNPVFGLEETEQTVTIGSYVVSTLEGSPCPTPALYAYKWGTIKLAEPLGDRKLVHAGLAERYADFDWSARTSFGVSGAQSGATDAATDAATAEESNQ